MGQYVLGSFGLGDSAVHWFDEITGLQVHEVFTGVYYSLEGRPAIDEAIWGNAIWSVGQLAYRGDVYNNIYLLYDLENDLVLTKNHQNSAYFNQPIRLNQEQIHWFTIEEEMFVTGNFSGNGLSKGFYHQLFDNGVFGFYAKRRKVRELEVNRVRLESDDVFYWVVDDKTYEVEKSTSLYKLFPVHKSALQAVFKSLRTRKFKNASVDQLKEMARRCAEIITPI